MAKTGRASSANLYMTCEGALWRIINDPGSLSKDDGLSSMIPARYSAFGTIVHYETQAALGCRDMEEPSPEDYIEAEPMIEARQACVQGAVAAIRKEYPDLVWEAEGSYKIEYLTGHTDLVSGKVLLDIKTASKRPARNQIAIDHYWQLLAYHLLTGCTDLRILYVNSKGEWTVLSDPVDMDCEQTKMDIASLIETLKDPRRRHVYGGHCSKCRAELNCRRKTIPSLPDPTAIELEDVSLGALEELGL